MTPAQADARLGVLAAYAFDMFSGPHMQLIEPPADCRLSPGWVIRGYVTACDALFVRRLPMGIGARVFYGYLAESAVLPGTFVLVIRGTADMVEWAIDAKFLQVRHPLGGYAEDGFYRLWQTLSFRKPGGPNTDLGTGIASAVGSGSITVIGHSLGAALATYTTIDLAANHGLRDRIRGRFFASPRPGDQGFADAFAAHVKDAVAYVYERDRVPEVPLGFGYLPLHCMRLITRQTSQALIVDDPVAAHHIYCYCAELDYDLMDWSAVPLIDKALTACILGPNPNLH